MTRDAWEAAAKKIWEDAFVVDEPFTMEVTRLVTGADVFAWSALKCRQIRALHRALFRTARFTTEAA
jgi:hypothetical protein